MPDNKLTDYEKKVIDKLDNIVGALLAIAIALLASLFIK
jgi:hypothetical protein